MTDPELSERLVREGVVELGDLCASSLGPFGGETLLETDEETLVTKDIHRLIDHLELTNPGARLVASGAVEQKERIGDGSLTLIVLAAGLIERAGDLLEDGFSRRTIEQGYHRAGRAAVDVLPKHARPVDGGIEDPRIEGAIRAAFARRLATDDSLVDAVRDAADLVSSERRDRNRNGFEDLIFEVNPERGGPPVELVRGVVLEREPVDPEMATTIDAPRIAVVGGGKKAGTGIETRDPRRAGGRSGKGRTSVSYDPDTPAALETFSERESADVARQVRALEAADVDAVFCTMGINDEAKSQLQAAGITAFRRLTSGMATHLANAVGGSIAMEVRLLEPEMVGTAGRLRTFEEDGDTYVRVDGCRDGVVGTLLFSNSIGEISAEVERDVRTAIVAALGLVDGGSVVPGGGGIETRLAAAVRDDARGTDDRQAIAMAAFADTLEDVPRALIDNAGKDSLDELTALRAAGGSSGFDCFAGEIVDTDPNGPLLPERVVRTVVESATEVACTLVRVDDVLPANRPEESAVDEIDTTPDPERDFAWRRS
ncbi:TCP-1/cpn60 chaperonin family protein [Natrarchaeobius sp. A-rgal3]|uniref:TCP-1/cpn60 chaperonin family protein n=1 Tax=Natrarchaeobius versutus TaxID=1679078 RepID=UPI00350FAFCC